MNDTKKEAQDAGPLTIERRLGGRVAVVWFDVPGEKMNTLRKGFEKAFERTLDELDADKELQAVVLASPKDDFIAGADIDMLKDIESKQDAVALMQGAHAMLGRMEAFRLPVVAAIHGACLGGGLEVAMACRARIAADDRKTKLGQPEVMLGVIPGAGGTQRLPRIVGIEAALDLILTGKTIPAKKARKLGLVEEVVPRPILVEAAIEHALKLAAGETGDGRPSGGLSGSIKTLLLEDNPVGRRVLFSQAKKSVLAKTHGNYPAPIAALECVRIGIEKGMKAGLQAEAEAFGELVLTPQAKNLMGIFFAQNALKKDTGVDDESVEPREVKKVGVLGAGLMGSGIAYVTTAIAKRPVRLRDMDDAAVRRGLKAVRKILDGRVERKRLAGRERDAIMALVKPTTDYTGFSRADVVIEAVFEDIDVKRKVLAAIEEHGGPETIFASNTSSLPITDIAAEAKAPERVIGMHYFSPVEKMPLLEVIVTEKTADWVTATCVELGKKQGKTVIVVRDGPGFYTSRIIGPYMNEASYMLADGVPIDVIDEAVVKFGFPVGPCKLLDEVGIDVAHKVGKIMVHAFGDRMAPPPGVGKLIDDERFGRKNGKGLYRYDKDGKGKAKEVDETVYGVLGVKPSKTDVAPEEIGLRCAIQMLNEAAHCYGEGILRSARDGDIGAVFGLGFPPFLGGPFRWADAKGIPEVVALLEGYQAAHGARFEPAPVLHELAKRGCGFHDEKAPAPGEMPREAAASKS